MDKYAVIRLQGQQFKVSEGDEILVGLMSSDLMSDVAKIEPEVLLFTDGKEVKIGKPVLKEVKVKVKVLAELEKGKKVEVYHFKAKSRYRKHTGFRAKYTRLLVEKIS